MPLSTSCSFLSIVLVEGSVDDSGGFYPERNAVNSFLISDLLLAGGGGVAAAVTFFCRSIAPEMLTRASLAWSFW